jgi:dephospho-CoA kinase
MYIITTSRITSGKPFVLEVAEGLGLPVVFQSRLRRLVAETTAMV